MTATADNDAIAPSENDVETTRSRPAKTMARRKEKQSGDPSGATKSAPALSRKKGKVKAALTDPQRARVEDAAEPSPVTGMAANSEPVSVEASNAFQEDEPNLASARFLEAQPKSLRIEEAIDRDIRTLIATNESRANKALVTKIVANCCRASVPLIENPEKLNAWLDQRHATRSRTKSSKNRLHIIFKVLLRRPMDIEPEVFRRHLSGTTVTHYANAGAMACEEVEVDQVARYLEDQGGVYAVSARYTAKYGERPPSKAERNERGEAWAAARTGPLLSHTPETEGRSGWHEMFVFIEKEGWRPGRLREHLDHVAVMNHALSDEKRSKR
jgi:hypothetical protein